MSSNIEDLIDLYQRLKDHGLLDRLAYTEDAFTSRDLEGVETYNFLHDQNIPTTGGLDPEVQDKGFRTQSASISREFINHMLGRASYNINILIETFKEFLETYLESLTNNINEYDSSRTYHDGDKCFLIESDSMFKHGISYFRCNQNDVKGMTPDKDLVNSPWDLLNDISGMPFKTRINSDLNTFVYTEMCRLTTPQNPPFTDSGGSYLLHVTRTEDQIRQVLYGLDDGNAYTRYLSILNDVVSETIPWFPTEDPAGLKVHALDHLYVFRIDSNGYLILNYFGNTYSETNNPFEINGNGELVWEVEDP